MQVLAKYLELAMQIFHKIYQNILKHYYTEFLEQIYERAGYPFGKVDRMLQRFQS